VWLLLNVPTRPDDAFSPEALSLMSLFPDAVEKVAARLLAGGQVTYISNAQREVMIQALRD
jgi:hypothetical protein